MKSLKTTDGYVLRFLKDEKLTEQLLSFVTSKKIESAWLSGFGATSGAEIGFYNLANKRYEWTTKVGLFEITNLSGNVSSYNNSPHLHIHITLADSNHKVQGGHLKGLVVGATLEVKLTIINKPLHRSFDADTGLNLLDL